MVISTSKIRAQEKDRVVIADRDQGKTYKLRRREKFAIEKACACLRACAWKMPVGRRRRIVRPALSGLNDRPELIESAQRNDTMISVSTSSDALSPIERYHILREQIQHEDNLTTQ